MIDEKIERNWSYINGRLSELEVLALQFILRRKMRIYIGRKNISIVAVEGRATYEHSCWQV